MNRRLRGFAAFFQIDDANQKLRLLRLHLQRAARLHLL